jgi:methylmalonyl-CoA mutase N-terminal domain/subunit
MTAGILRGIETGWFTSRIADASFSYQRAVELGEKSIVGVTVHTDSLTDDLAILRVSQQVEHDQRAVLAQRRSARDDGRVERGLAALRGAAEGDGDLIAPMLEAIRAEATLGEVCATLRSVFGGYVEPAAF